MPIVIGPRFIDRVIAAGTRERTVTSQGLLGRFQGAADIPFCGAQYSILHVVGVDDGSIGTGAEASKTRGPLTLRFQFMSECNVWSR